MCKNVTDDAVSFISTTLRQLQDINFARCHRISDSSMVQLADGLRDGILLSYYSIISFTLFFILFYF